jgi:osmotically-inducible protein OsmY
MISILARSTFIPAVVAAAAVLSGCAAAVVGSAVGAAIVATDRRTTGVQLEDQSIEFKTSARIKETVGERGHVSATSYNRVVLLTGEVNTEDDRKAIEAAVGKVENVLSVVNETAVMPNSTVGSRSNDALLTTKIKATYVDAKDIQANTIKVVTERATVFLMGRVTEREATRATDLARGVPGVTKVVRVFELLSEAELAALGRDGKK